MGQGTVNSKSGQDSHSTSPHHPRSDNVPGQDACPSNCHRRAIMPWLETQKRWLYLEYGESSSTLNRPDNFGVKDVSCKLYQVAGPQNNGWSSHFRLKAMTYSAISQERRRIKRRDQRSHRLQTIFPSVLPTSISIWPLDSVPHRRPRKLDVRPKRRSIKFRHNKQRRRQVRKHDIFGLTAFWLFFGAFGTRYGYVENYLA